MPPWRRRAILPLFKERDKPFVLVFWSRDPDGTQHYQGDSLNSLVPGINGPTSLAAIRNADDDLARIRAALRDLGLLDTTDIIVVADHGFSTISKESRTSSTVKTKFADTPEGQLPLGFVALDLAQALDLPLIDPDDDYKPIAPGAAHQARQRAHRRRQNQPESRRRRQWRVGLDLSAGRRQGRWPSASSMRCWRRITSAASLSIRSSANFPARSTLDDIALEGSAITPHPAIAISFRSFDTVCGEPVRCTVEVADTILQQGQGMHGSFSRADTWNFMAMQGPDFKSHFVDPAPASNADIGRTIAQLMRLDVSDNGKLVGRVLTEALPNGALPRSDEPRRGLRPGAQRARHRHQHADGGRRPAISTPGVFRDGPSACPLRRCQAAALNRDD